METVIQEPHVEDVRKNLPSSSGLERIALCPGSLNAEQGLPDVVSDIAEQGTKLHRAFAGEVIELSLDEQDLIERAKAAEANLVKEIFPNTEDYIQFIEQRLWYCTFSKPVFSGQYDILYRSMDTALIIDLKTGFIPVANIAENVQLRSYALLVSKEYPELQNIYVAVLQPRCSKSTELCLYSKEDIERSEREILASIERAKSPDAPRIPSIRACKYCKAKARCPELLKQIETVQPERTIDFQKKLSALSGPALSTVLDKLALAETAIDAVKAEAYTRLKEDPNAVPDYYLKPGNAPRKIEDPLLVWSALKDKLDAAEYIQACSVSVTKLGTIYGKKSGLKGMPLKDEMDKLIGHAITSKPNAPSLARVSK